MAGLRLFRCGGRPAWLAGLVLSLLGFAAMMPASGSAFTLCRMCSQSLFEYSGDVKVPGQAFSSATGDFNRDGIPDIAVANDTSSIYVFLGQGGTSFSSPTASPDGLAGRAVASGYFNNDRKARSCRRRPGEQQSSNPARRRVRGLRAADGIRGGELSGRNRRWGLHQRSPPRPISPS